MYVSYVFNLTCKKVLKRTYAGLVGSWRTDVGASLYEGGHTPCVHDCITVCRLVPMCKCIKVKCICRNANFSLQRVHLFAQPLTVQASLNARYNRITGAVSSSSVIRNTSSTRTTERWRLPA